MWNIKKDIATNMTIARQQFGNTRSRGSLFAIQRLAEHIFLNNTNTEYKEGTVRDDDINSVLFEVITG